MRILLATETYYPVISGVVIFTHNLAEELTARGHQVAIFAPSTNGLYQHQKKNGIEIFRFPSLPNPFGRKKTRIAIRPYSKVEVAFEDFKPDVVHLQSPSGVPTSVLKAAKKNGVPVIATQHFLTGFILAYLKPLAFMSPLTHRALIMFLNHFLEQCDYVTCPTQSVATELTNDGVTANFKVISNGIRLEEFKKAPKEHWSRIPEDRPVVLHVGRLDQDKNIFTLLESIPWVVEKVPEVLFVLAGPGEHVKKIRQWIVAQGLEKSVMYVGKLPYGSEHFRQVYHRASVFVIPSTIETQSLVTMEAIASGLPVVASKAGALPELVHHGKNGYLVESTDVSGFAAKIVHLLKYPDKAREMGEAGQEIIAAHDMEAVMEQFLDLYGESMKKSRVV
ncbi:glycosyltransferase family 4 protein [soil metagenome]